MVSSVVVSIEIFGDNDRCLPAERGVWMVSSVVAASIGIFGENKAFSNEVCDWCYRWWLQ